MFTVCLERLFFDNMARGFSSQIGYLFFPQNRQVSDPQHLNLWILRSI